MHPFPARELLQCFIGDAIAQVWLDPHSVQFRFESMRHLLAAQGIEHVEADGTLWAFDCDAAEGPPLILHRLLYRKIIAVDRQDFRLTFRFDDRSTLSVLSELGPFESGHINAPETGFIVF